MVKIALLFFLKSFPVVDHRALLCIQTFNANIAKNTLHAMFVTLQQYTTVPTF